LHGIGKAADLLLIEKFLSVGKKFSIREVNFDIRRERRLGKIEVCGVKFGKYLV